MAYLLNVKIVLFLKGYIVKKTRVKEIKAEQLKIYII